ncbi:MAG: PH domain-containing protein [Candidatus Woesearchaeota archaeon]
MPQPAQHELKPNRTAFVTYSFIKSFIITFLFFSVVGIIASIFTGTFVWLILFIIIIVVIEAIIYYSLTVRYNKERYIFTANKIIHKSGGIFSDNETELIVKNITNVSMVLPFIENKLLNTGNIAIQSAGSSAAEVYLSSISSYGKTYDYIQKLMQHNGFKLTKSKLVQEEQPSLIGAFFEAMRNFISTAFIVIMFFFYMIDKIKNINTIIIALVISIPVIIFLISFPVFTFLDLKNRRYRIYNDTITYKEGFLTKNYSIMPMENLSDTTTTQTLVDKIFSLYDVQISCQGTGQEVKFKNMRNGDRLKSNLDMLIGKTKSLVGTGKRHVAKEHQLHAETIKKASAKTTGEYRAKLRKDTDFTAEFRMDSRKTFIPLLLALPFFIIIFILLPLWLILLVTALITVTFTTYKINKNSMSEDFNFIYSKHKEFTNDKIMAVIFKENFIDKWFDTCSVNFWSIGSSEHIAFSNIKKIKDMYKNILGKLGIKENDKVHGVTDKFSTYSNEILYQMDSHFNFGEMLKANFFFTLFLIIIIPSLFIISAFLNPLYMILMILSAGGIIFLFILSTIYKYYYYEVSKMTFHKEYVYFQRGIFFKEFYYVPYDNIKDITTTKYPFSSRGSIRFDVAGEHVIQSGKEKRIISNGFNINYVDDIENKDELIDLIFHTRPSASKVRDIEQNINKYSPAPILTAKQDMINSVVPVIIIFPFIIFLPLIIWYVKVKRYVIQPYRVYMRYGMVYKKQKSIVFSKIDYINFSQGMLNKMFSNGNITLNTTGSSTAELTINDISNFKEFYEILKKYYER